MMPAKTIVLVHGAWADGSSWAKVIPLLVTRGHEVTAVQLPLTSLADDVATVKRAIARAEGPIVLDGHSYGGVVITEAGHDPQVAALAYIAFAPDAGESAGSLGETVAAAPLGAQVRPDAQGFLKLTKAGVFESFAQDLADGEKTILHATEGRPRSAAPSRTPRGARSRRGTSSPRTIAPSNPSCSGEWRHGSARRRSRYRPVTSPCWPGRKTRPTCLPMRPPDPIDAMREQPDVPGREWAAVVRTSGTPAFATAFAPEATLEASVLSAPLRGAEAIGRFFNATSGMYESIAFTSEHVSPRRTYLEWSGTIFGGAVAGVTILARNDAGRITSVCLYHRPFAMVTRFAAELARRLFGQVDPSALAAPTSASG